MALFAILYAGNGALIVNGNTGVGTTIPSNMVHVSDGSLDTHA